MGKVTFVYLAHYYQCGDACFIAYSTDTIYNKVDGCEWFVCVCVSLSSCRLVHIGWTNYSYSTQIADLHSTHRVKTRSFCAICIYFYYFLDAQHHFLRISSFEVIGQFHKSTAHRAFHYRGCFRSSLKWVCEPASA